MKLSVSCIQLQLKVFFCPMPLFFSFSFTFKLDSFFCFPTLFILTLLYLSQHAPVNIRRTSSFKYLCLCVFSLCSFPYLLCHFPFTITGTYALTSALLKNTVTLTWRWSTSLSCLWGCRCLLLVSVYRCLSSPHPVCPPPPLALLSSLSLSSCLPGSLPAFPLHFNFVSPPPSSLPPILTHLD